MTQPDALDRIIADWARLSPAWDTSPIAVIGRILRAAKVLHERADATLAAHGLTRAELDLLSQLRRSDEPLRPSDLTAGVVGSAAATTKRLARLTGAGLVQRAADPSDGRASRVRLTWEGARTVEAVMPELLAAEAELLAPYTPAQRVQLADLLRIGVRAWDA